MYMLTEDQVAGPQPGAWKAVYRFWPICDSDGTWLILTEAECRLLADGHYEYRALLPSI